MNINGSFLFLFLNFILFSLSYSSEIVNLKINQITTSYIGKKGILILKTDEIRQNIHNIINEEEIKNCFKTTIYSKNNDNFYEINCGFLKGLINSEIYIFCEIGENINSGEYTI